MKDRAEEKNVKKPKYILDSYALIAYFQAKPAGAKVRTILKEASNGHASAFMSVISLGEIITLLPVREVRRKP